MKIFRFCRASFVVVIFLSVLYGCFNSYIKAKPVTPASAYPAAIEQAKIDNRSFILHSGINVYTITSVELDKAKQELEVQLNKVDSLNIVYVPNAKRRRIRPEKGNPAVINEIHVYTKDSISYTLDEPHTIPLEKVARIDLLGKG